jgi:hypothetical protein
LSTPMKTHPLAKLQLLFAVLWLIPSVMSLNPDEAEVQRMFLISMIPYVALSIITIRMGWLMVVRKEIMIYPQNSVMIMWTRHFKGEKAAKKYIQRCGSPNNTKVIGIMNLFSGILCLCLGVLVLIGNIL